MRDVPAVGCPDVFDALPKQERRRRLEGLLELTRAPARARGRVVAALGDELIRADEVQGSRERRPSLTRGGVHALRLFDQLARRADPTTRTSSRPSADLRRWICCQRVRRRQPDGLRQEPPVEERLALRTEEARDEPLGCRGAGERRQRYRSRPRRTRRAARAPSKRSPSRRGTVGAAACAGPGTHDPTFVTFPSSEPLSERRSLGAEGVLATPGKNRRGTGVAVSFWDVTTGRRRNMARSATAAWRASSHASRARCAWSARCSTAAQLTTGTAEPAGRRRSTRRGATDARSPPTASLQRRANTEHGADLHWKSFRNRSGVLR